MKRLHLTHGLVLISVFCSFADESEKLESVRKEFDKRLNAELDKHTTQARTLRVSYLGSLNRLKVELGRQNNLRGAAQVVAEIEAIEAASDPGELGPDAHYRLKELRQKWEKGIEAIIGERNAATAARSKAYFQYLDAEQERLTRAARIEEALLIDAEKARVSELPEVKAAFAELKAEEVAARKALPKTAQELREFLHGTTWDISNGSPEGKVEYTLTFNKNGTFAHSDGLTGKFETSGPREFKLWGYDPATLDDDFKQFRAVGSATVYFGTLRSE